MVDTNQLVNEVIKHADIVKVVQNYLTLTKKGKNYVAICPFHDDTNPSMVVSPEKQLFKCFVCGTGGNAISFVKQYEHVSFMEAVKKVAEISGYHPEGLDSVVKSKPVDEKQNAIIKCLHDLSLYYQFALNTPEGKEGLEYFESRHLDSDIRSKYKLGYAFKDGKATIDFLLKKGHSIKTIEDSGIAKMISVGNYADMNEGRVVFPICDPEGNVIGFSARILQAKSENGMKYVNTPETYLFHKTNNLYNFHIAKDAAKLKGYIYVCEGFMDIFALSKIGIDAAVAIMGTALTKEHIQLLRSLNVEVRLCLDGDLPGQSAMMKISNELAKAGLKFVVIDNQNSTRDPDEILSESGEEALKEYLSKFLNRFDFALNYYTQSNPLKTIEQKKNLLKEFLPILSKINSQIELDNYLLKLEKITGFDRETIRTYVNKNRLVQNDAANVAKALRDFHPERKLMQKLCLAEREMLYQMLGNDAALSFFERNVGSFYDDMYRQIANYLIEYHKQYNSIELNGLISFIEQSDVKDKDAIIEDLTRIVDENYHCKKCNDELLNNLLETMQDEKSRISEEDMLHESLENKDELEQARIIAEFNKMKTLKK
ncbi:MAG: DNA primase [Bacilli bacterium]|nr:DNA primase [Bacilli bacterium]